jgi:trimeric autotransporter adhesin
MQRGKERKNRMNPLIQLKRRTPIFLVALVCFGLSPASRALLPPPPPDGGYPGGNTAEGDNALFSLTTGIVNTAIGFNALFSNTNGSSNTAIGSDALRSNTSGSNNAAIGSHALLSNIRGNNNTATGINALFFNDTGRNNTATGFQALAFNQGGSNNTANGVSALFSNFGGSNNTANGVSALFNNFAGINNTGTGFKALFNNGFGNGNTASGANALLRNFGGMNNTATGINALLNNTTGSNNIAVGADAGRQLTTGDSNIHIANTGVPSESGTIRIGSVEAHTATFIAGIFGSSVPNGVQVVTNPNGKLGTVVSSARFKEEIKPMDKASEAIHALKPVTFRYKHELDPNGIPQFGLVAEQVEKVNPDLVARDADGKLNTVRYDAVNAMLLNEFLKEHRKNEEQEATIAQLKTDLQATAARQQKQIEALTAGLQKVSAQLELSRAAPQTVLNDQ